MVKFDYRNNLIQNADAVLKLANESIIPIQTPFSTHITQPPRHNSIASYHWTYIDLMKQSFTCDATLDLKHKSSMDYAK